MLNWIILYFINNFIILYLNIIISRLNIISFYTSLIFLYRLSLIIHLNDLNSSQHFPLKKKKGRKQTLFKHIIKLPLTFMSLRRKNTLKDDHWGKVNWIKDEATWWSHMKHNYPSETIGHGPTQRAHALSFMPWSLSSLIQLHLSPTLFLSKIIIKKKRISPNRSSICKVKMHNGQIEFPFDAVFSGTF